MRDSAATPRRITLILPLLAVALISFGLRPPVSAIAPIYPEFANALDLSPGGYAALGAFPPLCFAVCGVLTTWLSARWSVETLLFVAVSGTTLFSVLRASSPSSAWMMTSSVAVLLFVGISSVLLPVLVKISFSRSIGRVTAMYAALIAVGSALPPLLIPALISPEHWRASLLLWASITGLAVVPCSILLLRSRKTRFPADSVPVLTDPLVPVSSLQDPSDSRFPVHRSRTAWALTSALTATSVLGYFLFAWLPILLMDQAGADPRTASLMLGIFAMLGFPAFAIGPFLAVRMKRPWVLYICSGFGYLGGLLGLLLMPALNVALWVILLSTGQVLYSVAMTLLNTRTDTVRGATALSGFMQSISYAIGALATWSLGALYLATHRWEPVLLILVVLVILVSATGFLIGRGSLEQDLEHSRNRRK